MKDKKKEGLRSLARIDTITKSIYWRGFRHRRECTHHWGDLGMVARSAPVDGFLARAYRVCTGVLPWTSSVPCNIMPSPDHATNCDVCLAIEALPCSNSPSINEHGAADMDIERLEAISDLADRYLDEAIAEGDTFSEALCNWALNKAQQEYTS